MASSASIWTRLLEWLREASQRGCVFRGHADSEWKLIPSVGRDFGPPASSRTGSTAIVSGLPPFNPSQERRVADEFRRLGLVHAPVRTQTKLEWLALAQHYGAPTRLLDWTGNPLVAAWFAAASEPKKSAHVFAFEPMPWSIVTPEQLEAHAVMSLDPVDDGLIINASVVFVAVPILAPRMAGQSGLFSWQCKPWEKVTDLLTAVEAQGLLEPFEIPAEAKPEILIGLAEMGIDEMTLYGDLGGVGRSLNWRYKQHRFLLEER